MTGKLSHFDSEGDVHMVDVGGKAVTHRVAVATGTISMRPDTMKMVLERGHKKGDVLTIARIAGIMAAKRTSELVPLCHPVAITRIAIAFTPIEDSSTIACEATVETRAQTGVEMEALTAVQIALLTVHDMCKSVDRGMVMSDVGLKLKSGGKSGTWKRY